MQLALRSFIGHKSSLLCKVNLVLAAAWLSPELTAVDAQLRLYSTVETVATMRGTGLAPIPHSLSCRQLG